MAEIGGETPPLSIYTIAPLHANGYAQKQKERRGDGKTFDRGALSYVIVLCIGLCAVV